MSKMTLKTEGDRYVVVTRWDEKAGLQRDAIRSR